MRSDSEASSTENPLEPFPGVAKKTPRKKRASPRKAKKTAAKKKATKKSAAKKMAAKKTAAKKTAVKKVLGAISLPAIPNKAEFVRSLPKDLPAKEVVAMAKSRGTQLTESYVYNVRGAYKTKGKAKKLTQSPSSASNQTSLVVDSRDLEALFFAVVAELSVPRAFTLLAESRGLIRGAFTP